MLDPLSDVNVSYIISVTSLTTNEETIYRSESPDIMISDLTPYTTYTFKIAVENILGRGPYSTVSVIRTPEAG